MGCLGIRERTRCIRLTCSISINPTPPPVAEAAAAAAATAAAAADAAAVPLSSSGGERLQLLLGPRTTVGGGGDRLSVEGGGTGGSGDGKGFGREKSSKADSNGLHLSRKKRFWKLSNVLICILLLIKRRMYLSSRQFSDCRQNSAQLM